MAALLVFGLLLVPVRAVQAGFFASLLKLLSGSNDHPIPEATAAAISMPLLGSRGSGPAALLASGVGGPIPEAVIGLSFSQDNALVAVRNPAGTLPLPFQDQILLYTVEAGDTPGAIAERFGISLNTLLWANSIRNPNLIQTGDQLVILPVSGVQYEVAKGDTIESIARKFKGDVADILSFNGLAINESLVAGTTIIIPDGEIVLDVRPARPSGVPARFSQLPDLRGFFLRPISTGRHSRSIHGFNGVDLADGCGLPVFASVDGQVITTRTTGWNGGYGKYVAIGHSNGVQTLYAHLSQVFTSPGQKVGQGAVIGLIGSTGNSTGCHLHFEVRGAKNPF